MAKSFRDLKVWQLSMDLTEMIYALTTEFPKHEIYGLASQMRRAAVSIPSNLAEGSARASKRDFKQFVVIAHASNCELQTQLMIAARLKYGTEARIREAEHLSHEIGRMLSGLSYFLAKKPQQPPPNTEN